MARGKQEFLRILSQTPTADGWVDLEFGVGEPRCQRSPVGPQWVRGGQLEVLLQPAPGAMAVTTPGEEDRFPQEVLLVV